MPSSHCRPEGEADITERAELHPIVVAQVLDLRNGEDVRIATGRDPAI